MKMLGRRGMIVAAVVTFLLATLSQIGIGMAGLGGGYLYYDSISRSGSLALGILLALFADRLPGLARGHAWAASGRWTHGVDRRRGVAYRSTGAGSICAPCRDAWWRASRGALAILYACLGSRSRLVRSDWVVRLGKISYGLYMLHSIGLLFMLDLLHPRWGWKLLATKALGLVVTVLFAWASYRWVESPFLRWKDRFATVLSRPI